ncbi:DUF1249 domain-containing protein [Thalassotalea litorea]|uniref:DUF1249 domain-containing protein n=1 Tax=Thalassotalea litorea TaxID=2020715 RepID=A0A5R9IRN8_9GAMM|nr:DUF1249 domain-containing protein [Thalassotalea litorea]TLU67279.1 DUF1249 domain-containing protein [Thalassotalea litorea]
MTHSQRYHPDLKKLLNSCEINYVLLLRLMGNINDVGELREFFIDDDHAFQLTITEQSRYTHVVEFRQLTHKASNSSVMGKLVSKPFMVIRLYHDARVAEIIESAQTRQIKPRYDYPNQAMMQPDEKQQTQLFLTEWLQTCLRLGQTAVK